MFSPIRNAVHKFFQLELAGSILLLVAAILALIMSNSTSRYIYDTLLHTSIVINSLNIEIKPVEFWVNDGLMALFFLLVGLELKREMIEGQLSRFSQVILPTIAAVGGMLIPALIYIALNWDNSMTLKGWAIPSATDIVFSLGVLVLLGSRVPLSLKLFLLALAIIDDLGAIIIIALFYSNQDLHLFYLTFAAAMLIVPVILFHWKGISSLKLYLIIGFFVWFFVLKSGIHATLAGVALAFFIPISDNHVHSPLHHLEHSLHPWVAYGILPFFVFVNAGVSFEGMTFSLLSLSIILGLFFGKQLGVLGFTWLTVKSGIAQLPEQATWMTIYGVSILCGIGFTMSLFIGSLAFTEAVYMDQVRLGVLIGSFISAVVGYFVLLIATARPEEPVYESDAN